MSGYPEGLTAPPLDVRKSGEDLTGMRTNSCCASATLSETTRDIGIQERRPAGPHFALAPGMMPFVTLTRAIEIGGHQVTQNRPSAEIRLCFRVRLRVRVQTHTAISQRRGDRLHQTDLGRIKFENQGRCGRGSIVRIEE